MAVTKRYPVPFTGAYNTTTQIGVQVRPVTGWGHGSGVITNDLSSDGTLDELIQITTISRDYPNRTCVVEIVMPDRFEARFDAILLNKTSAEILAATGDSALVLES